MSSDKQTPEEREALVRECLPQLKRLAGRLAARLPPHIDVRDLAQAGLVGLLDAMERFDPERGILFWSYAESRVRGAMLDSLRRLDPLPRAVRRRRRELEQAFARLEGRLGRAATDHELADELGVTPEELAKTFEEVRGMEVGLCLADGTGDLIQFVADEESPDPFTLLERREMREHLAESIRLLPDRDQLLVSLYYKEELTMKEIGKVLNVNESRVSQLHTRAVLRLRGHLAHRLGLRQEDDGLAPPGGRSSAIDVEVRGRGKARRDREVSR